MAARRAGRTADLADAGRPGLEGAGRGNLGQTVACGAGDAAELAAQVHAAGTPDPDHVHIGVRPRIPPLDMSPATADGRHVSTPLATNAGEHASYVDSPPEDRDGVDAAVHSRIPMQQPTGTSVDRSSMGARNSVRPRRCASWPQRREIAAQV